MLVYQQNTMGDMLSEPLLTAYRLVATQQCVEEMLCSGKETTKSIMFNHSLLLLDQPFAFIQTLERPHLKVSFLELLIDDLLKPGPPATERRPSYSEAR